MRFQITFWKEISNDSLGNLINVLRVINLVLVCIY